MLDSQSSNLRTPSRPSTSTHTKQQHPFPLQASNLPITLRHPLQFILLLNRITITAPLRRINQLLSKTLRHALDIAERRLARADSEKCDGLIDAAQGGNVDGLAAHGAGAADAGAVFAGTAVYDCVDGDLEGVGVGGYVDLWVGGEGS